LCAGNGVGIESLSVGILVHSSERGVRVTSPPGHSCFVCFTRLGHLSNDPRRSLVYSALTATSCTTFLPGRTRSCEITCREGGLPVPVYIGQSAGLFPTRGHERAAIPAKVGMQCL